MKYCLIMMLSYFIISNIAIYLYAKTPPKPNANTMIILGAKVTGNPAQPSETLQERLDVAITYLKQYPDTKVIVCGGQGKNESATESSVMKSYLIANGIHADSIVEEDQSTRTAQQFIYPKKMMELGSVVVVTSDFHLLRSMMLAKRSGLDDISGLAAPLNLKNPDRVISLLREPLALINSFLFDYPV